MDPRRRDRRRAGVRLLRGPRRVGDTSTHKVGRRRGTTHLATRDRHNQLVLQTTTDEGARVTDRLTVGVAARLSRYLQVLTQAKKMGKERISSQEMSDYTNINATQIRRDLSAFGKFGKRG